ncbi:MAG: DUF4065 domain-containing protein [Candidatus Marinimicrobia bacterium]|nr:DUF4065 domain-containing protein [Candidatus Neomarinimicrobiota bacterium]
MAISVFSVANYFIKKSEEDSISITNMKLQKLVYFANAFYLAMKEECEPLFRERIQAWKWGPVVEDLYHEFKEFGGSGIQRPAVRKLYLTEESDLISEYYPIPEDEFSISVLDIIWTIFKDVSASDLSNMTHVEGSPWDIVFKKGEKYIDSELIQKFYTPIFNGAIEN